MNERHKELTKKHKCPKCRAEFKEYTNLTNHVKACRGTVRGTCPDCGRKVLPTNMATHRRENCPNQNQQQRQKRDTNQIEGIEINRFTGKDERRSCPEGSGAWITAKNMARHRNNNCPRGKQPRPLEGVNGK